MKNFKKKGFTLIELIAVLVIMAILALIVTPLVMNVIRKARISADKRSIDAYGRSIELAIAGYLLYTSKFPTEVSQLTIEYSGNKVECETTQINPDSSVYLAGCTVAGRNVEGYTYGIDKSPTYASYSVGDHISYNGVTYYVIEDSGTTNAIVKLLKEKPLTVKEINDLNINGITVTSVGGDSSYGSVQYGSSTDYSQSTVKQVVDAWKNNVVKSGDAATARLIDLGDLTVNLGYEHFDNGSSQGYSTTDDTPSLVKNYSSWWTMIQYGDSQNVYVIGGNGGLRYESVSYRYGYYVRPVLELNKSADITMAS